MHNKEKLMSIDTNYGYYSKQMSDILKKVEYNCKERKADFFDEKLFQSLNSKMKTVDIRAKEVEFQTNNLNNLVRDFNNEMAYHVREINKMDDERFQSLLDSLNQINVFQTNFDMNNKYDTNNFNEGVENIKNQESSPKNWEKLDTYSSQVFDELMTKEDVQMHEINPEEEEKYLKVIQGYVDRIEDEIIDFTEFENKLMNVKINRYLLVTILNKQEDHKLKSERHYQNMSKMINCLLKGCNKNDDSDFLKCIITNASKLYYDVEETDDAVIRTYVTEGIRKNKIWDNTAIWGKAIFKDFRDIIRKFKIPEEQKKDVNKDEVLRNVLFNRLMFYIDKLSYFDMYKDQLNKIITR